MTWDFNLKYFYLIMWLIYVHFQAKFIDYGTMEEVGVDKLRYLHRDFALYPPLAIRSKLAGIQPKKNDEQGLGNRYENSTCHIFYDISSSGDLEAEVVEYNVKVIRAFNFTICSFSRLDSSLQLFLRMISGRMFGGISEPD